MNITETLAQELNLRPEYVKNVISLLDEGNTIPFIARYRKEMQDRKSTRLNSSH